MEGALEDLLSLSEALQDECMSILVKLEDNLHLGRPLESKNGRDLRGFYKLYFNNAKYRIIYKKVENHVEIEGIMSEEKIAEIYGIGKRDKEYIYKIVAKRVNKNIPK